MAKKIGAQKNATPLFLFFFLSFCSYAKILEDKEFLLYMTFEVTCQKRHHGEKRVDKKFPLATTARILARYQSCHVTYQIRISPNNLELAHQ